MTDVNKADASGAEVDPTLRESALTQSEVTSSCAVETRQSNKTGNNLGGVAHGVRHRDGEVGLALMYPACLWSFGSGP
jgi:hypothetical protein